VITAVDTNVLVDVLEPDLRFGPGSREALRRCTREGSVIACEVVWAELATAFGHAPDALAAALGDIGIAYSPMTEEAALRAAACWREHVRHARRRGRIVADYLIGGHASVQADRLLTRDGGFFRRCFGHLRVLDPTE